MARRDPLQGVGDEVARPALRVRAGLLLHLPHHAREVVADELLGAVEHDLLRLLDGEAGDALELAELVVLGRLRLLLELLEMALAVEEALLAPLELGQLAVDLLFLRDHPLLDLGDLGALVLELLLDVGAELERLLARLDLRLAPDRLGGPDGVGGGALALRLGRGGTARKEHARPDETADDQPDHDPEDQEAD